MGSKLKPLELPERRYRGANVPFQVIRRFARRVAAQFRPDKIVLFGSYAYGTPHPDSDVDILVVMPARNQHDQAVRIRLAVPAPFPMDLIVRTRVGADNAAAAAGGPEVVGGVCGSVAGEACRVGQAARGAAATTSLPP